MKELHPDEVALLRGFLSRDQRTLTQLHGLIHKKFYWLAFDFLQDESQAADAVNDAFLAIIKKEEDDAFTSIINIEAWLYNRVRWNCLAILRKKANHGNIDDVIEMPDEDASIEDRQTKAEYLHLIVQEIAKLPKRDKKIIELYFFEDMTTHEIAAELGMNVKTVHNTRRELVKTIRHELIRKSLTILILGILLPIR